MLGADGVTQNTAISGSASVQTEPEFLPLHEQDWAWDTVSCRALWLAVIFQAAQDYIRGLYAKKLPKWTQNEGLTVGLWEDALEWLMSDEDTPQSFVWACHMCNLDPDVVRETINKRPERFATNRRRYVKVGYGTGYKRQKGGLRQGVQCKAGPEEKACYAQRRPSGDDGRGQGEEGGWEGCGPQADARFWWDEREVELESGIQGREPGVEEEEWEGL